MSKRICIAYHKTLYLIRHGETQWALTGQHTGLTDIPLTENGKRQSQHLAKRLKALAVDNVFVSPLQRALETCEIAGYEDKAIIQPLLVEWDYGKYEGLTRSEIEKTPLMECFSQWSTRRRNNC